MADKVRLNAFVEPELRKQIRIAAAKAEETLSEYIRTAILMRLGDRIVVGEYIPNDWHYEGAVVEERDGLG